MEAAVQIVENFSFVIDKLVLGVRETLALVLSQMEDHTRVTSHWMFADKWLINFVLDRCLRLKVLCEEEFHVLTHSSHMLSIQFMAPAAEIQLLPFFSHFWLQTLHNFFQW